MGSALETIDDFQRAAELHLKGFKATEIARELEISVAQARSLVKEYEQYISTRAMEDPEFLDRVQVNTLMVLDEVQMQSREAWALYEELKNLGDLKAAQGALKLASDLTSNRAKLLNLMGAKADGGMYAKMNRLEQVNEIVTKIIRETISGCERCKKIVQLDLAEAFSMMDKKMEPMDMDSDITDAEIIN